MRRMLALWFMLTGSAHVAHAQSAADAPSPQPASTESPAISLVGPPAAATASELTSAELEQLGFDTAEPATDYNVKLSGFVDFGTAFAVGESRNLMGNPAFSIGNLNVYLSKSLSASVRTMVEVRFLYLPNGSPKSLSDRSYVSTAVSDYNDFNRELRWGGVEIERVYVEWAALNLLTVRVGQFLTPYGVWNVDHGTPAIIPIQRPFVIGYSFFPERQTGFELYGGWGATSNGTVGYHLTLSNGTGPVSEYADLDKNKAVGGRLYWEYRKWGELKLGGSAYYGRYTSSSPVSTFDGGKLKTTDKILSQSDSLAFALDASFKYQGAVVQAEFVAQQQAFTPEGRTLSFSLASFKNNYPADSIRYGGYLLLGYRLDWFGVMPYVVIQRVGGVDSQLQAKDRSTPIVVGLNVRPIESLVAKLEYVHVFFDSAKSFPGYDIQTVAAQLAWAF